MTEEYKGGLRGAQMFRRRVDDLFEIIDTAKPDEHFTAAVNRDVFSTDTSRFKRIDATNYFSFHDNETLIPVDSSLDDDGKPNFWPFRYATLLAGKSHDDDGFGEDSLQCWMLRSISHEEARGKARIYGQHMLSSDTLVIHKIAGVWRYTSATFFYSLNSRRWVDATWYTRRSNGWAHGKELPPKHVIPHPGGVAHLSRQVDLAMSMAEAAKANWFVEIGRNGGMSFQFATLPGKISGIFKARDIKNGEARRAALKNWVSDHWRTDANNPEFEVYVRKHLRGAETFTWGDYYCTVHPAVLDLEEAERAKEEREMMGDQAKRQKFVEKPRVRVPYVSRHL